MAFSYAICLIVALALGVEQSFGCGQNEVGNCMAKYSQGGSNSADICKGFMEGKKCLEDLADSCSNDNMRMSINTVLQTLGSQMAICTGDQGHGGSHSNGPTVNGHEITCDTGSMSKCFEASNSDDMKVRCGGYNEYMACYNAWKKMCWDAKPMLRDTAKQVEQVAEETRKECIARGYSLDGASDSNSNNGGVSDSNSNSGQQGNKDDGNAASALGPMNLFMMVATILMAAFCHN